MQKRLIKFLQVSVCSLSAVAVAFCARFASLNDQESLEPRRADAPEELFPRHVLRGREIWEEQRIDAMENQLQAVSHNLQGLRQALDLMGPFDDVPVAVDALADPDGSGLLSRDVPDAAPIRLNGEIDTQPSLEMAGLGSDVVQVVERGSIFSGVKLVDYSNSTSSTEQHKKTTLIPLDGFEPRFDEAVQKPLVSRIARSIVKEGRLSFDLASLTGAKPPLNFQGVLN